MKVIPEEKPMTGREVRFATWAFVVILLIALAMIVFAPGCTMVPLTERAQIKTAYDVCAETMISLTRLKIMGAFSKEEADEITEWKNLWLEGIDTWKAANEVGMDSEAVQERIRQLRQQILVMLYKGQRWSKGAGL